MTHRLIFACAAALATTALPAFAASHTGMMSGSAKLMTPDGQEAGQVTLTEIPNGVLVQGTLNGLPAGPHGFHIHENGTCEPDFEAAGGHYNPMGKEHGIKNEAGRHAGDLPNIHVDDNGKAEVEILTQTVSFSAEGEAPLMKEGGTAVIVHENADTHEKEAGAGGRIACGVIEGS